MNDEARPGWKVGAPPALGVVALALLVAVLTVLAIQTGNQPSPSPAVATPSSEDPSAPTSSATPTPAGEDDTASTPPQATERFELESSSYVGNAFETVRIDGTYIGARAGTSVRVQRQEGSRWVSFPLPAATDASGRFSAYVELARPGRYRLRIVDPDGGVVSEVVVLRIDR